MGVPSAGRVERTLDQQATQQVPRGEDASTNFDSVKTLEETLAPLTNGHPRGGTSKGEKSITENPTAPPAGEKTGCTTSNEKTNGSAFQDKGKKNRGEPPFTKQEMEEKEALLDDLCGHLGTPLEFQYSAALRGLLTCSFDSHLSNSILGKRRRGEQFPFQHRQNVAAANL